jgi:hypothetical protein
MVKPGLRKPNHRGLCWTSKFSWQVLSVFAPTNVHDSQQTPSHPLVLILDRRSTLPQTRSESYMLNSRMSPDSEVSPSGMHHTTPKTSSADTHTHTGSRKPSSKQRLATLRQFFQVVSARLARQAAVFSSPPQAQPSALRLQLRCRPLQPMQALHQ